ncbi:hypothetical protein [Paludisphaera mucosa]|uniref:Neutral/alkaline non-lysosomal ceramidase N-terminal domain-containing protein n=1 Tax=Paludisphaera mucosa TaxID=3030827 RepID=A0ABT6FHY5_9BACT|nr:hypothetical protein [Paludisphaera mucosa]MDG3007000.1 hypothetical protein [Paludisphaera mucosa]
MKITTAVCAFRAGLVLAGLTAFGVAPAVSASELHAGAAVVGITPDRPVALSGQMHTRISREVASPVVAAALALESRDGEKVLDQAILVACDLVAIPHPVLDKARVHVRRRIPGFDDRKLILSATHTHTAPVVEEGNYEIPKDGVVQPGEYIAFLAERVADAAVQAWEARKPSKVGWGLGHAVIAQNRRSVYADGRAVMYGPTEKADFRGIEGPEDQGVEVLFVWDAEGKLRATAVNVACPAQEVEGESSLNADFWHQIREALHAKHGADLVVLGWTGAAGDQSPHLMYRKRAEDRMRALRRRSRLEELAARVVAAWEEAYEGARQEQVAGAPLVHKVDRLELPLRIVTEADAASAAAKVEELSRNPAHRRLMLWHQDVVDRRRKQEAGSTSPYTMELHVLRLGDVAIATNPFELYTQYGIQMKARSRALQTFLIQLAGPGSYLPTEPAVRGGGYSAIAESNEVGPEGGQVLSDRTVELINALWPE